MSKSIKKYLCIILSMVLVLSFTACKSEKEEMVEGSEVVLSTDTNDDEMLPSESPESDSDVVATPEPTEEPEVEHSDEWSEKIPWGD